MTEAVKTHNDDSDYRVELKLPTQIEQKLHFIREEIATDYPFIHRLAIAIINPERGTIQTFASDEDVSSNIHNYEAILSDCDSLQAILASGEERVINDMSVFNNGQHRHTELLKDAGYHASYTVPLAVDNKVLGFFFANSRESHVLVGEVLNRLKLTSMIIALWLHQDIFRFNVLKSTIESMRYLSKQRDPETGEHLLRMSSYSLLIAREVANVYQLSDSQISYIYFYAQLHDLGKITIPDNILLKNGKLTPDEFDVMKTHTTSGEAIAKKLIHLYGLENIPYISILSAVVRSHHEKLDGSGYPDGLAGEQIPIEARIVAVADIFDALTTHRPYKTPWTNQQAFDELQRQANVKLDPLCVEALTKNEKKITNIQRIFRESEH